MNYIIRILDAVDRKSLFHHIAAVAAAVAGLICFLCVHLDDSYRWFKSNGDLSTHKATHNRNRKKNNNKLESNSSIAHTKPIKEAGFVFFFSFSRYIYARIRLFSLPSPNDIDETFQILEFEDRLVYY